MFSSSRNTNGEKIIVLILYYFLSFKKGVLEDDFRSEGREHSKPLERGEVLLRRLRVRPQGGPH